MNRIFRCRGGCQNFRNFRGRHLYMFPCLAVAEISVSSIWEMTAASVRRYFSMFDTKENCQHDEIEAEFWPSITELLLVSVLYRKQRPPYVFTRMLEQKILCLTCVFFQVTPTLRRRHCSEGPLNNDITEDAIEAWWMTSLAIRMT